MKILHLISGKASPDRANGVNQVIHGLAQHMTLAGHEVRVLGISTSTEKNGEVVDRQGFRVEVYHCFLFAGFHRFKKMAADCDIVHLHGVWSVMNILAGRHCRHVGKPYVLTPHCMYAQDRLRQSRYLLKMFCHYIIQKKLLEKAAAVHALSREELTDIAQYSSEANIIVVPNGIDWRLMEERHYALHRGRQRTRFGFLGRLAPEKNLVNLINALATLPQAYQNQVELWLIGPVNQHGFELQSLVQRLQLDSIVHFDGPRYGEEKIEALLDLDVYIHPASSEGFSLAVAEALSLGLPAIISRTSNMSYYYSTGAFLMCEPVVSDIRRAIVDMIKQREEWLDMSAKARALCQAHFTWQRCASELLQHYQTICEKS